MFLAMLQGNLSPEPPSTVPDDEVDRDVTGRHCTCRKAASVG